MEDDLASCWDQTDTYNTEYVILRLVYVITNLGSPVL